MNIPVIFPGLAVTIALTLGVAPAPAAEISTDKSMSGPEYVRVVIRGAISQGDDAKFTKAAGQGRTIWLDIDSPGGDVEAAMRIGAHLRKNSGIVAAGKCFSACVLVYAGAVIRSGSPAIGVHRLYFAQLEPALTALQVSERYNTQVTRVRDYLAGMNISPELVSYMQSFEPSEVRILTQEQLRQFGLGPQDSAYNEFLIAQRAADMGISSFEYRQREQRGHAECKDVAQQMGDPSDAEVEDAARRSTSAQIYRQAVCGQAILYGIPIELYRYRSREVSNRCRDVREQNANSRCQIRYMATGK
jgi:hypothetical protein